ncbi:MAG TPA: hypothetical protein VHA82_03670 [Ramlibacter sp.]|uniref:hypothetical protein n=1 Tax=Ramlibacter sp. TaxID=1917967 RepID=UPI002B52967D|nr:hypothetical protein [Ramlibacter sp.]HVZ42887.1 hypothetical protein [Ramlibacter sp.]
MAKLMAALDGRHDPVDAAKVFRIIDADIRRVVAAWESTSKRQVDRRLTESVHDCIRNEMLAHRVARGFRDAVCDGIDRVLQANHADPQSEAQQREDLLLLIRRQCVTP